MDERRTWNEWNTQSNREHDIGQVQLAQAAHIERWLDLEAGPSVRILEVGCGTGWMCERLAAYGPVTGIDLADEVVDRARARLAHLPDVRLVADDFLAADLGGPGSYDVVVSIETMAHFRDQSAFLHRIADLLAPEGLLMLAAQNRPMMERNIKHLPNAGWYRRWVDHEELRELVDVEFEVMELRSSTPKFFDGPLHILNSAKVERAVSRVGLGRPLRGIKRWEERRFMGFTLMCLAKKRPAPQNS